VRQRSYHKNKLVTHLQQVFALQKTTEDIMGAIILRVFVQVDWETLWSDGVLCPSFENDLSDTNNYE